MDNKELRDYDRYTPNASIIRRATAVAEYCCWPVIRLLSRIACDLKRPDTIKFVSGNFLASSSIQNGCMRWPTNSSAYFSSEFANPVQVLPFTRSEPFTLAFNKRHVPWQRTAVIFPAW